MNLRFLSAAFLFLLAASCTATDEAASCGASAGGCSEVVIGASRLADTRTSLDPDGHTTRWAAGDRIAVWARDDAGFALDAQTFALHTFKSEYGAANFSATIGPMPEGTYTYYAVYPLPARHSGTEVSFTLPAVQSGNYDGAADIMVAAPTAGPALEQDPQEELTLAFRHLCHAVRIEIPSGRNRLGTPVKRLEIVFPTAVAGTLTFDAARPDSTPVLTDGTNTVAIDFPDEGLTDAAGAYAWIFIAPTDIEGEVAFRAYDSSGYQAAAVRTSVSKRFEAGHTTPIALTVPEARPLTWLDFTVATNNLGEELTQIRIEADEELFAVPFAAENAEALAVAADAEGRFRAAVYADAVPASTLGGRSLGIDYESENALLRGHTVALPADIADGGEANVPMNVPYLFEEDFSGVTGEYGSNDNKGLFDYDADDLKDYGVPGWSISRARVNKYALALRHYVAWSKDYYSCINSAPLSQIKPEKSVQILVTFNAASESDDIPCILGGYNTETKRYPGTGDGVEIYGSEVTILKNPIYAGYDKVTLDAPVYQFQIAATHTTCLRWKTSADLSGGLTGKYSNTYIDNIRVNIVK